MCGSPPPLTDLHTHILPGLDDGATDLAQALALAKAALLDGITRLAATPHNLRWPPGSGQAIVQVAVAELERHLAEHSLPLTVVAGAETALISALPRQIDAGEILTLNGSRYLLLEPPYAGLPAQAEQIIQAVQAHGLVPILAHPERSPDLRQQPERIREWVEQGVLVQITAASLEGLFGRAAERCARRLLAANLAHIIASDAHSPEMRPPRLTRAQAIAAQIVGAERALALVATTPAAILDDRPVAVEPPRPPGRKWFGGFGGA